MYLYTHCIYSTYLCVMPVHSEPSTTARGHDKHVRGETDGHWRCELQDSCVETWLKETPCWVQHWLFGRLLNTDGFGCAQCFVLIPLLTAAEFLADIFVGLLQFNKLISITALKKCTRKCLSGLRRLNDKQMRMEWKSSVVHTHTHTHTFRC